MSLARFHRALEIQPVYYPLFLSRAGGEEHQHDCHGEGKGVAFLFFHLLLLSVIE